MPSGIKLPLQPPNTRPTVQEAELTWRERSIQELDPKGLTTRFDWNKFNPRFNICPATREERRLRELEKA